MFPLLFGWRHERFLLPLRCAFYSPSPFDFHSWCSKITSWTFTFCRTDCQFIDVNKTVSLKSSLSCAVHGLLGLSCLVFSSQVFTEPWRDSTAPLVGHFVAHEPITGNLRELFSFRNHFWGLCFRPGPRLHLPLRSCVKWFCEGTGSVNKFCEHFVGSRAIRTIPVHSL